MNYDTMTDRELDKKIHTEIMGKKCRWIQSEPLETKPADGPIGFTCNFGGAEFGADRDWHFDVWFDDDERLPLPNYSTDIAAAWQVVEKMRETIGKRFAISLLFPQANGTEWIAIVTLHNAGDSYTHTNPCRAICIAALKAVEVMK